MKVVTGIDISLTILWTTMIYGSLDDANIIIFIKMVDKLQIVPDVNHWKYGLQPVYQKDLGRAFYQVLNNPISTCKKTINYSSSTS